MHELTSARSIFRITDRTVVGRTISTIYLDAGVLHQVVPDTLDFVWRCMSRQSENLARSKLRISLVSAVIICEGCGADTPIDDSLVPVYATYSSTRYHTKTGEEFIFTEMNVS